MPPVPVAEKDFLEQDAPIRGQNFVCVSFVSPEDVIQDKQAFAAQKFLESFCISAKETIEKLESVCPESCIQTLKSIEGSYPYIFNHKDIPDAFQRFCETNADKISSEFDSANDNRTSVRGVKIRGCYETLDQAKKRGEHLIKNDPHFHVFIGEVGCWCPWSPNPDDIEDDQYAETQLNTLMKEYKQNCQKKQAEYEDRKRHMVELAIQDGKKSGESSSGGCETITVGGISEAIQKDDPVMLSKNKGKAVA